MAGLPFFYGETVTNLVLSIILTILVVAVALGFALWLRRLVVRRLKKTVLDDWLVQTIGVLVMIPVVIAGFVLVSLTITLSVDFLVTVWNKLTAGLRASDIANGVRDLIETLLIIVLAVGVGRTLMRLVVGRLGEQRLDINIRTLIGRISYGLIVLICIFWILSLWSVSITVPVTVISALSVAVAFAIQDILKDLVAGLYILFERPFHIGDQITVANYTGRVESVEVRATKLRLTSGEEMTIPNALVFGGTVVNNTQFEERRATVTLTMPQQDFDKEKTPAMILKTVRELENVLVKPEPFVYVVHYTSSATAGTAGAAVGGSSDESAGTAGGTVVLSLRFWMPTGRYQTVTEVMSALHEALPGVDLLVEESGGNV
jgi:small-conductance mechanosensitive channel